MTMTTKLVSLIVCLFLSAQFLQAARIWGNAAEYAGQPLELYYISDGISERKISVAKDTVDAEGNFSLDFDAAQTLFCKMDVGIYTASIFVEPDKSYNVNLPERHDVSRAEKLNPYFKREDILLSINQIDNNDLNMLISSFEDDLDSVWNNQLFDTLSAKAFDEAYTNLELKYAGKNQYFDDYRQMSYALLLNLFGNEGRDIAISNFLLSRKPLYNNPAYWEAFSSLLERFQHLEYLKTNKELYDLAVVYNVSDGYLSRSYLDSVSTEAPKIIADYLSSQRYKTEKGRYAEIPYLINLNGDTLRWNDFYEPYIYLCFANSDLKESRADMDFVQRLKAKWKNNFAFVFVFTDEDKNKCVSFCKNYKQKEYICSISDNPGAAAAFLVMNSPAYFVLTNQGQFDISPAVVPAHFEP